MYLSLLLHVSLYVVTFLSTISQYAINVKFNMFAVDFKYQDTSHNYTSLSAHLCVSISIKTEGCSSLVCILVPALRGIVTFTFDRNAENAKLGLSGGDFRGESDGGKVIERRK